MQITVALDGAKRRDLKLFHGDGEQIEIVVYEKDADEVPLDPSVVTDLRIDTLGYFNGSIPVTSPFTVPDGIRGRNWFTLYGTVDGARRTLAFGIIEGYDASDSGPFPRGNDYGWRWPYGGNAWDWI